MILQGHKEYIDILSKYLEIHATTSGPVCWEKIFMLSWPFVANGQVSVLESKNCIFILNWWFSLATSKVLNELNFIAQVSTGGAAVRALASHHYGPGSIPGPGMICE